MPDPSDDIARIAALRGKPAEGYVSQAAVLDAVESRVPPRVIEAMFAVPPDPEAELLALDTLPPASRHLITEAPVNISAVKYAEALADARGREGELIHLVAIAMKARAASEAARHFGPRHPNARRSA